MRLLEVFLLMELRDRLAHVAKALHKKIVHRWMGQLKTQGSRGLPFSWKDAMEDGQLPAIADMENLSPTHTKLMIEWMVEWFAQYDPTQNKKYTDWLIRQWIDGRMLLEDASSAKRVLETFEEHKKVLKKLDLSEYDEDTAPESPNIPPPERRGDLNSWKDYRLLSAVMRPLTGTQPVGEKVSNYLNKPEIQDYMNHPVPDPEKAFGPEGDFDFDDLRDNYRDEDGNDNFDTMDWYNGFTSKPDEDATTAIKPIYKSDRLAVLQPNTKAAACELGRGTEWCTAYTEADNEFWTYAPDGPLYVILTDKMGKFQWHFDSEQFMDIHDQPLSEEDLAKLVTTYPELKTIFATKALKDQHNWLVDPELWTPEKLKDFAENNKHQGALFALIKDWEGIAPEETIQYLEQLARTKPAHAYQYLRNPTEADYERAIEAILEAESEHYSTSPVVRHAAQNGITLSDEMIRASVKDDARTILEIPPEQIGRNPDMVLDLPLSNSYIFRAVADSANGQRHPDVTDVQGKLIMDILSSHPEGMKAVMAAMREDASLINNIKDYFGTDLWKQAYFNANNKHRAGHEHMQHMAQTITRHTLDLDYKDLSLFLIKNKIADMPTFQAIEQAMGGELPEDVQQELFKASPATLLSLEKPHNRLKYLATKQLVDNSNEYQAGVKKAWDAKQAAAKQSTADGSITEGVSPILYHVSQIGSVNGILTDNEIRLTPDFGTGAEKEHQPEGKIYYLSTARSKTGGYGYPVSNAQKQGAMVVFDGRALMADGYTGKAVDYWGPEFRKLGKDEMEDRIFSKKPTIPNASKYIKEIHILFDTDNEYAARNLKALGYKAKRLNVPLYIYDNQQAFALLNKNKAASVTTVNAPTDKLPLPGTDVEPRDWRSGPPRNYFGGWIELLKMNDASRLSKAGKDALNRAHYFDANQGLDADIHNARTNNQRPHLDKFLAVLQQFKIKSTTELMAHVNQKFN
jgi:hypothetical protein